MPLINFGSIFSFAEEIETQDRDFFQSAALQLKSMGHRALFEQFAGDAAKNIKTIQRIRREHVTEMILEAIGGFSRQSFLVRSPEAAEMTESEILSAARTLENRAVRYYEEAAEKLKAQPEASRALKQLAKMRKAHLERLAG